MLNSHENLAQVLQHMQTALEQLIELLNTEYEQLAARNVQAITDLAQQKQHLCETLEQLEKRRAELISQPAAQASSTQLEAKWQAIMELAAKAQKQNTVNGIIADNGRRHTQHVINLLHGQSNAQLIYGATGTAVKSNDSDTPIARA